MRMQTKIPKRPLPFGGIRIQPAPKHWRQPCAHTECTLHQLSPYIGKLKSSIAADLVESYSKPGDIVIDPFAGAGTIPLEALTKQRTPLCGDISPYATILSNAKLHPPSSLSEAIKLADQAIRQSSKLSRPDLRHVPTWVRRFYHPETLREIINFSKICSKPGNEFLMACLLGILHHQRPGFLSYPSSHLVPYLRDRKYPKHKFPDMYAYRPLKPRLVAKITRSYKRFPIIKPSTKSTFQQQPVQSLNFPRHFGAVITSPPYMNALDYGRDNRLRLWFIAPDLESDLDGKLTRRRQAFIDAIECLALKVEVGLKAKGYCVFVVGEEFRRSYDAHPSEVVYDIMTQHAPSLRLKALLADHIPDVRRTRKECTGVKTEHILIFQRK